MSSSTGHNHTLGYFTIRSNIMKSQSSSVTTVSNYGLDDREIGVRSPAVAVDISSALSPDQLWGPPSLLPNGYRGSFPREESAAGP
jgi:hypothetical protein